MLATMHRPRLHCYLAAALISLCCAAVAVAGAVVGAETGEADLAITAKRQHIEALRAMRRLAT